MSQQIKKSHPIPGGFTNKQRKLYQSKSNQDQLAELMKEIAKLVHIKETLDLKEFCKEINDIDEDKKQHFLTIYANKKASIVRLEI